VTCPSCAYASSDPAIERRKGGRIFHARWRPRCASCGSDLEQKVSAAPRFHEGCASAPVRCGRCGHLAEYPVWIAPAPAEEGHDPVFGLPLFLRTEVRGQTLWALNARHLDLLAAWLGASLRERPADISGLTMMAGLPRWMKARSNREAVMAGIHRLRAALAAEGTL
jgi:hypothetical protein